MGLRMLIVLRRSIGKHNERPPLAPLLKSTPKIAAVVSFVSRTIPFSSTVPQTLRSPSHGGRWMQITCLRRVPSVSRLLVSPECLCRSRKIGLFPEKETPDDLYSKEHGIRGSRQQRVFGWELRVAIVCFLLCKLRIISTRTFELESL